MDSIVNENLWYLTTYIMGKINKKFVNIKENKNLWYLSMSG